MSDVSGSLPSSGRSREIYLKALSAYRESCQPPELTPDCPFFTWTSNGPACGEECADLLAEHGYEDPEDRIDLGGGIVLLRQTPSRRPRRGPGATDRPFDARQIYMSDEDRPHADRRTVALIMELETLICVPPRLSSDLTERSYDIQAVQDQLTSRGFDADSLIRYGIGVRLSMSIVGYVLLPIMKDDEHLRPMLEGMETAIQEPDSDWMKFFEDAYQADTGDTSGTRHEKARYAIHGFLDRVMNWLAQANLNDIKIWNSPTLHNGPSVADGSPQSVNRINARWITDRFTACFAGDWQLSSLYQEWLYLHGRIPAPCSSTAMAERKMNAAEISAAIAKETSENWRRKSTEEQESRASDFIGVAASHLRNGKPELAGAIFEALTFVDPNDAEALNNYGFCLIAIDPSTAVEVLQKANRLYKGTNLITLANSVLALHLAHRNSDAYTLAVGEQARALPSQSALMWLINTDDEIKLSEDFIDARQYLTGLVTHLNGGCSHSNDFSE